MPTDVVMPQMGESIVEGTITKWLKKAGDRVEKDEVLFEISTDKVDAEIPSPVAGILTEIKVPEGATVEINTVVAVIGGSAPAPSAATPAATPASAAPAPQAKSSEAPPAQPQQPSSSSGRPLRSSPLVRRIAKENNLDLNQIAGTGSAGRITKDDALRYLSQRGTGSTAPPAPSAPPPLTGDLVPMTKMRAIIAQRMVDSVRTSPHVHTVYKIDMTRVVRLREREKA
ncbi:MAG TPA: biotin/lipoyl-containing protein, partial [Terracidiphilus sp.]|nr:biotin/lipoyl-containing protein [Terracidiphilus sp.]